MTHPWRLARAWFGLTMLIGASSIAHAEPAARIDAGAFLGGNYFSGENELGNAYFPEQTPESAFLIGLRGSYSLVRPAAGSSLAPRLSLELEGKLALSSTGSATERMRPSYFAPVVGWRAQAILDLWSEYRAHPFAVLGVGGETIFSSSPFVASGDSDAAMYWGVGAKYALAPRYGLRGDVRHGITAGRFDTASSTVEAHVGFYYAFSLGEREEPVARIEVAEAEVTQEPIEPEDRDEDGIPDADDVCPTEAELVNEIEDEDGCPELDADEDGLVGELDQCPAEPEDREGFEDEDGCPDPDNDQDSHADASDECPQEAETDNGFEDEDGCPDEVPARVAEYIGVIEGIRFGNGSARIQGARTRQILDQAAAILLEYPSVHIRISGHTDARGSHARNMAISRERADAVKWYLVDKGIEHTRLVTMGYGPEQPIADNDTPEGRAKNRRIEFELLTNPIVEGAPAKQDEATPEGTEGAPEQAPAQAEQDAAAPAEATGRAPE